MIRTRTILMAIALVGFMVALAAPATAQQFTSPDDVKTTLRLLVQVSNDFKRQITNNTFARIPHEYMEYTEAADALRAATKGEPADFKARMETRLKATVAAYQKVSAMSAKETNPDKLMTEHAKAVTEMNALFDLFPAAFRPDPNLPPGRGGRSGSR